MSLIKFTREDEYIIAEGETGTVGITNHAQELLGDITFIELPVLGQELKQGDKAGVVESVKAASDVFSPVSGTVVEINKVLEENPALANEDAEGAGWFFKIKMSDPSQVDGLMDRAAYRELLLEHG